MPVQEGVRFFYTNEIKPHSYLIKRVEKFKMPKFVGLAGKDEYVTYDLPQVFDFHVDAFPTTIWKILRAFKRLPSNSIAYKKSQCLSYELFDKLFFIRTFVTPAHT